MIPVENRRSTWRFSLGIAKNQCSNCSDHIHHAILPIPLQYIYTTNVTCFYIKSKYLHWHLMCIIFAINHPLFPNSTHFSHVFIFVLVIDIDIHIHHHVYSYDVMSKTSHIILYLYSAEKIWQTEICRYNFI